MVSLRSRLAQQRTFQTKPHARRVFGFTTSDSWFETFSCRGANPFTPIGAGEIPPPYGLMGPRLATPKREIIGIGCLPACGLLRFKYLVGNALTFAIGHRLFPCIKAKRDLLLHIAGACPA